MTEKNQNQLKDYFKKAFHSAIQEGPDKTGLLLTMSIRIRAAGAMAIGLSLNFSMATDLKAQIHRTLNENTTEYNEYYEGDYINPNSNGSVSGTSGSGADRIETGSGYSDSHDVDVKYKNPNASLPSGVGASSRTDDIRRARQNLESSNEEKVVQRLEADRIAAEKARSENLLKRLESGRPPSALSWSEPYGSAGNYGPRVEVSQERLAPQAGPPLSQDTVAVPKEAQPQVSDMSYYLGAAIGFPGYHDFRQIKGVWGVGVTLGAQWEKGLIVEALFHYSRYDYEYFPLSLINMNQYNFGGALKYQFLRGMVRPVIGGLATYTRRSYSYQNSSYYSYYPSYTPIIPGYNDTTDAVDFGLSAGFDVILDDNFSVGAEFKNMWNLSNRNRTSVYYMGERNTIEDQSYYMINVTGKLYFGTSE